MTFSRGARPGRLEMLGRVHNRRGTKVKIQADAHSSGPR